MKRASFCPLVLAMIMLYGCTAEPLSSLSPVAETTTLPAETTPPASTTQKPLVTTTSESKPVPTPTQEPAQSTQEPTVVPSPPTTPAITSSWTEVSAPSNIAVAGALWIETDAGEGKKMLASVCFPEGEGPFPVGGWLHA